MRKIAIVVALVALVSAGDLQGSSGYAATSIVTAGELRSLIEYPLVEPERTWDTFTAFTLGLRYRPGGGIAVDADGTVFFTVTGWDPPSGDGFSGLVSYDGLIYRHLAQFKELGGSLTSGARVRGVVVSPVTSGLLTAGHPVLVVRNTLSPGNVWTELWSIDPATAAPTLVHTWAGVTEEIAIEPGLGTIYAADWGNSRILKLAWNGSAYASAIVPTPLATGQHLRWGPDQALYAFAAGESWSVATTNPKLIYRIDPITGAYATWATVPKYTFIYDWNWADDGRLWLILEDAWQLNRYLTFAVAGATASQSDAAVTGDHMEGLAVGTFGDFWLQRFVPTNGDDSPLDDLWHATPDAGDSSQTTKSKGKGGGGGKGKKK